MRELPKPSEASASALAFRLFALAVLVFGNLLSQIFEEDHIVFFKTSRNNQPVVARPIE